MASDGEALAEAKRTLRAEAAARRRAAVALLPAAEAAEDQGPALARIKTSAGEHRSVQGSLFPMKPTRRSRFHPASLSGSRPNLSRPWPPGRKMQIQYLQYC